jgi:hypothetical protein
MSVVVVGSGRGSPGATTTALALALSWPRPPDGRVLLVEADPDGGSLAIRLDLHGDPGLLSLTSAARHGAIDPSLVGAHSQPLAGGVDVLVGSAAPEQMGLALSASGERLPAMLASCPGLDVVVDVGRASSRSVASWWTRRADLVVLVARPRRDEVEGIAHRAADLVEAGCRVGLVCIGATPHPPGEFAEVAGVELLGVIDEDRHSAAALAGEGALTSRLVRRSRLLRQAGEVTAVLAARLEPDLPATVEDRSVAS